MESQGSAVRKQERKAGKVASSDRCCSTLHPTPPTTSTLRPLIRSRPASQPSLCCPTKRQLLTEGHGVGGGAGADEQRLLNGGGGLELHHNLVAHHGAGLVLGELAHAGDGGAAGQRQGGGREELGGGVGGDLLGGMGGGVGQGFSGLRGGAPGLLRGKPVRTADSRRSDAARTAAARQLCCQSLAPISQPASTALTSEPDAMIWQLGSRMAEEW